jgi:cation transport ATPase
VPWTAALGAGGPGLAAAAAGVGGSPAGAGACLALAVAVVGWDAWARAGERRQAVALATATAPRIRRVGRDGAAVTPVPAGDLAAGEVVEVAAGDVVPADARVLVGDGLMVDEIGLVGDTPVSRRCPSGDPVREGAVVLRGVATLELTADPGGPDPASRPVWRRRELRRPAVVAALLVVLVLVAAATVVAGGVAGGPVTAGTVAALLAALAAPAVATRAVARARAAAAADLLASGTALRAPDVLDRLAEVDLLAVGTPASLAADRESVVQVWTAAGPVTDLVRAVVVGSSGLEEPTERGLADWAAAMGVDVEAGAPQVSDVPYDAGRGRVTTAHEDPAGILVVCKGAPDTVWPLLVTSSDGKSAGAAAARPVVDRWTREGLRVVAVATTRRTVAGNAAGRLESGLRLLGLVGLAGRLRPGAAEAVAAVRAAGVDVALLTPDHETTALSRAREAGIATARRGAGVVTGEALRTGRWADDLRVLARLVPEQHRDAVARWHAAGHAVALTAATVPQIPAVRLADVGVALGAADEALVAAADVRVGGSRDEVGLAPLAGTVAAARRVRVTARLLLGLSGAVLLAVWLLVAAGVPVGQPWLTPAQGVVAVAAALVPVLLRSPGAGPTRPPPGGQLPSGRLVDVWWVLWVLAWGAGTGLLALAAGGVAVAVGAPAWLVAGPVVAGALAAAAAGGVRRVSSSAGDTGARGVAGRAVPVAAGFAGALAALAVGPVAASGSMAPPAVVAGLVAGTLAAVAGAVASRAGPQA